MIRDAEHHWQGTRIAGSLLLATLLLAGTTACTSATTDASSSSSGASAASAANTASAASAANTASAASAGSGAASPTAASSMPEVSIPAPATTPVPPPQGGDISSTVAAVPVTTMPAIAVTQTAQIGSGVTVEVEKVKPITGVGRGPGEVGGPAAAVTVKITNSSSAPIALNEVQVSAVDNSGTPAGPLSGAPAAPLTGNLDAGDDASGVYVFSLGPDHKNPLKLSISYSAGAPVALYTADVSN